MSATTKCAQCGFQAGSIKALIYHRQTCTGPVANEVQNEIVDLSKRLAELTAKLPNAMPRVPDTDSESDGAASESESDSETEVIVDKKDGTVVHVHIHDRRKPEIPEDFFWCFFTGMCDLIDIMVRLHPEVLDEDRVASIRAKARKPGAQS